MHFIWSSYCCQAEMVQLPEEEERRQGTVTGRVYLDYFMAGAGVFKSIVLIILCLLAQGAYIASDWWLSYWYVFRYNVKKKSFVGSC